MGWCIILTFASRTNRNSGSGWCLQSANDGVTTATEIGEKKKQRKTIVRKIRLKKNRKHREGSQGWTQERGCRKSREGQDKSVMCCTCSVWSTCKWTVLKNGCSDAASAVRRLDGSAERRYFRRADNICTREAWGISLPRRRVR